MSWGHRSSAPFRPPARAEVVSTMLPSATLADLPLPTDFDWRDVGGVSYVTSDVNQHVPRYCGSCWIHGTVAALNDRIKIMRSARFPDVMLSRQTLMNCVPGVNASAPPGCDGGDAWQIHEYLERESVPDETCQPYEVRPHASICPPSPGARSPCANAHLRPAHARRRETRATRQAQNGVCDAMGQCRNCVPDGLPGLPAGVSPGCFGVPSYVRYGVAEYGDVKGEAAMQREILARGPIVCSFAADVRFVFNYSEVASAHDGVYVDDKRFAAAEVDHDVAVSGWGVSGSGVPYWIIRNSWGTYWGEGGWFRLRRGVNQQFIESDCSWAVPRIDDLEAAVASHPLGDYVHGVGVAAPTAAPFAVTTPRPSSHRHDDSRAGAGRDGGLGGDRLRPPSPAFGAEVQPHQDEWESSRRSPPEHDGRDDEQEEQEEPRSEQGASDLPAPPGAVRVPLVSALLLAAVALTTASAVSISLLKGSPAPACSPLPDTPPESSYRPPLMFEADDYRPAGSSPPMRFVVSGT